MKTLRPATMSLALLLVLTSSGLQVFCAPVAATAPMACHIANACGDMGLQAGCCCLRSENSASPQFVSLVEPPSVPMPSVGMAAVAPVLPRSSALKPRPNRTPQPHPPLFQLYCSFLI